MGHGITVQASGSRIGCAGGVDHDSGNGAAVDSTAENTQHHQHAHIAVHSQCDRQHDGHAHDGGKPGHYADKDST